MTLSAALHLYLTFCLYTFQSLFFSDFFITYYLYISLFFLAYVSLYLAHSLSHYVPLVLYFSECIYHCKYTFLKYIFSLSSIYRLSFTPQSLSLQDVHESPSREIRCKEVITVHLDYPALGGAGGSISSLWGSRRED